MPVTLVSTPEIQTFLGKASECAPGKVPMLKSPDGEVEWATLKAAAEAVRASGQSVDLQALCQGSKLALKVPVRREVSPEFRKELDARRKAADQVAYDKLVRDVTGTEAKSKMHGEYLPTMKLQVGQGIHVAVTMGLGYALGSQFGAALSVRNPLVKHLGGVLGVMVALVFETVLFMARANMTSDGGKKYMHLLDPERTKRETMPPTLAGEAFTTLPTPKLTTGTEAKKER